jgi:HIRAN domain
VKLFKRKLTPKQTSIQLSCVELCGDGYCAVVGESFYQEALRATSRLCTTGADGRSTFTAVLVAEPDNPYDANAIAVYSPAGKVGHLSRDDAFLYQEVITEVARRGYQGGACNAHLTGGQPDRPFFGVVLQLADPDECLDELDS